MRAAGMVSLAVMAALAHRGDVPWIVRWRVIAGPCGATWPQRERRIVIEAGLIETGERFVATAAALALLADHNIDLYARRNCNAIESQGNAEEPCHLESEARCSACGKCIVELAEENLRSRRRRLRRHSRSVEFQILQDCRRLKQPEHGQRNRCAVSL